MITSLPYPGLVRAWLSFIRPKTWGVAIAPVVAALALVFLEHRTFSPIVALLTLTLSITMQIITNMENDLGYTQRKAEKSNRKGLPRATANGWISITAARRAILLMVALGLLNTVYLVYVGGWGFLLIGCTSMIAAYCYMGGPIPIAYTPFGEVMVLIFFGLMAVCGTYYLQAMSVSTNAVLLGCALGSTAASVLAVNNWRDREHDASIARRTLAVVASDRGFQFIFAAMLLLPFIVLLVMSWQLQSFWVLLPLVLLIRLPDLLRRFTTLSGYDLNTVMFACVKLGLLYATLFTAGVGLELALGS